MTTLRGAVSNEGDPPKVNYELAFSGGGNWRQRDSISPTTNSPSMRPATDHRELADETSRAQA